MHYSIVRRHNKRDATECEAAPTACGPQVAGVKEKVGYKVHRQVDFSYNIREFLATLFFFNLLIEFALGR